MALNHSLAGDILEVIEVHHSAIDTRRYYWYYDIKNWLVSSTGKKGETPNRPMTPSAIAWVQKYYLTKLAA